MGFFNLAVRGCRRSASRALNYIAGKFGVKSAKTANALKKAAKQPIPVGKPVETVAAKEPGFFERLAQLHEDKAYNEYREVFNLGLPFDHYLYMH